MGGHKTLPYFIGDLHFYHKRIIDYVPQFRPFSSIEEHNRELIARWNATVPEDSVVWVLGDVSFAGSIEALKILGELKGRKKLVMGNHDKYKTERYLPYFQQLYGVAEINRFVITHIPVHPGQFYRYIGNIHGHLHEKVLDDPRYINVSAEQINLTPIRLDKIEARFNHLLMEKRYGWSDDSE